MCQMFSTRYGQNLQKRGTSPRKISRVFGQYTSYRNQYAQFLRKLRASNIRRLPLCGPLFAL